MGIKNFELISIEAKRFANLGEKFLNIRIDHNSTVTMITPVSEKEASFDFRFTANFVGIGVIKIEGKILYECNAKDVTEMWSKTGNLPNDVASEIHTVVMMNCIPEAVLLARDLRLPSPIPLPTVQFGKKPQQPKSGTGIEVA